MTTSDTAIAITRTDLEPLVVGMVVFPVEELVFSVEELVFSVVTGVGDVVSIAVVRGTTGGKGYWFVTSHAV